MSAIDTDVQRLEVVLRSEEDLYRRMRDLLRREEAELVELDPAALERIVDEKRTLAEEGRLLEESRRAISAELAVAVGLEPDGVKLSSLVEALGAEAGELGELHARLAALVGSSRALLEANESFANRSLARVQETLRLLGRSVPGDVEGYGPRVGAAGAPTRGRLVRQAI